MKRKLLTGLGLVGALVGFTMLFEPALARALATSRGAVVVVGILATIQGYRIVRERRRTAVEVAETGDPETEQDLPVPGDDFAASIDRVRNLHGRQVGTRSPQYRRDSFVRHRRRIRNRLEAAALATITRKYGCTEQEARAALEAGTWTDDPFAAAFFSGALEDVGLLARTRLRLSAEGRFERRATRAARAIADLSAADRVPGEVAT